MKEILQQTLLFDFYGELLKENQRNIYRQFLFEDLTVSEIAQEAHSSRQGVHEMVRRCQRMLTGYEEKLHLVERFLQMKEHLAELNLLLQKWEDSPKDRVRIRKQIQVLSELLTGDV